MTGAGLRGTGGLENTEFADTGTNIMFCQIKEHTRLLHPPKNLNEVIESLLGKEKTSPVDLNWFSHLIENHNKELEQNQMAEIIDGIHNLIRKNKIKFINNILGNTLDESSSQESIVTLLRASFPIRSKLPKWGALYRKARGWLLDKELDPDKILIGLQ